MKNVPKPIQNRPKNRAKEVLMSMKSDFSREILSDIMDSLSDDQKETFREMMGL